MIRGFAALVFAAFFVSSAVGEVIRIAERIEVSSERMSLGDIARILPANAELANVPIGYAPYPGHYRWITKPDIKRYLYKWGLDQGVEIQMDDRILITRESQQVQPDVIEEEVLKFLSAINPGVRISIQKIQIPQDLFLPTGSFQLSIDAPPSIDRLSGLSLKLNFYSDGEHLKSRWVRVKAVAEAPIVVVNKDVPYGQPLKPSDLEIEDRQSDRLGGFFTNRVDVIGSVAKRSLREGEVVTKKDLREAVLVKRGDVVTLLARGPAFVVSALGRSRDSGSRGDAVVIENLESKELVHATVVGNKTVEVIVAGGAQ